MAKDKQKPSKKLIKKSETFRQRAEKASIGPKPKRRHIKKAASKAFVPFAFIGRLIAKVLRPFKFLLWPFKTKPVRFIGRVLGAILLLKFFREAWQELRKVTWPNSKETRQLTTAVFLFAVVFGLLIAVTDYGLDKLFRKVLLK